MVDTGRFKQIPVPGLFFVERFDSMSTVEKFQAEMETQGLTKLRQQVAQIHFLMAVPAYTDAATD